MATDREALIWRRRSNGRAAESGEIERVLNEGGRGGFAEGSRGGARAWILAH